MRTGNGTAIVRTITGATDVVVFGGPSIALRNTAVTPGNYTAASIIVDAKGRNTAATNGSEGAGINTVSVVTAKGISGSVANGTTAPAITLTLRIIEPTSINAAGNVSGTNTGDQIFTGNVTSSVGNTTTIGASKVTYSKIQAMKPTNCWALGKRFLRKAGR